MKIHQPSISFSFGRYMDDIIYCCHNKDQAEYLLGELRMGMLQSHVYIRGPCGIGSSNKG